MADNPSDPTKTSVYRRVGPRRFWGWVALLSGWLALKIWLEGLVGWPERYGLHCHGKGCMVTDYWYSYRLLSGGLQEYALFACNWMVLGLVFIYLIGRSRRAGPEAPPK